MQERLIHRLNQYPEWLSKIEYGQTFGLIFDPEYQPKSFDIRPLNLILHNLTQLISNQNLLSAIE